MEWTLAVFLNISGSEHWFRKLFHQWKWPPIQLRWSWLIFEPKTATTDDKIPITPNSFLCHFSLALLTHSLKMLICDCEDEMEILAKLSHLSGIFIVVCGCYRCRRLLCSFVGTFWKLFSFFFLLSPIRCQFILVSCRRRLHVIGIFDNVQRGWRSEAAQQQREEEKLIKFTPSLKFVFRLFNGLTLILSSGAVVRVEDACANISIVRRQYWKFKFATQQHLFSRLCVDDGETL